MRKPYDHNVKAGNEGDVVKHAALIAAIQALLRATDGPFRYQDAFAGYASNPLQEDGEWERGIQRVAHGAAATPAARWYLDRIVAPALADARTLQGAGRPEATTGETNC